MRLSTGIAQLDEKFSAVGEREQGLPAGSVVVVQSPPAVQCDSLLAAGIDQRETVYFSTVRSEPAIRESLARVSKAPDIGRIVDVQGSDAIERILEGVNGLDGHQDVILEVVDVVEETATTAAYVDFLDRFSAQLAESDSIALLHGLEDDHVPPNRRYTLEAADFVWNLRCDSTDKRRSLEYYLSIPKARGVDLAEEDRLLEVDLGRDFFIDETRNI